MTLEDDGYEEFCQACIPPGTDYLVDFEKVVNFENVGLVIYRSAEKSGNVIRDKKGSIKSANKTVIVHNTRDKNITSEDVLREMQTRKMTCPRCRQIIGLALKLLRKVPAINKKAILGICDHCKLKHPCLDCKETIRIFLSDYKAKANQEQVTEKHGNIKYVPEDSFINKETSKQQRGSAEQLIEELLHRKYSKVERELEISDLFRSPERETEISDVFSRPKSDFEISAQFNRPQTPRSTKSLPVIDENKKQLRLETVDRPFIKPSSDPKTTVQKDEKNVFAPDVYVTDLEDNLENTTYSPTTTRDHYTIQRITKQKFQDFVSMRHPSKRRLDIESIITDDNILIEPLPVLHLEKLGHHKGADIFPEHPILITHEREKYDLKDIDGKYLKTIEKKNIEFKTIKPAQLRSDRSYKLEVKHSILKKGNKLLESPSTFQPISSYGVEMQQKDFAFSFHHDTVKPENELTAGQKTSFELIKDTQDILQSQKIKRENIEKRLQKEEKLDKKRLAKEEKTKLITKKKTEAERTKNIFDEMQLMKNIELDLFKESGQREQRKSSIEVRMTTSIKKIEPAEMKTQLTKLKTPKDLEDKIQKELEDNKQKELEYITLKELENKNSKVSSQQLEDKKLSELESKKSKELEKKYTNENKNVTKKGSDKTIDNLSLKLDNENKEIQTPKQKQEFLMGELNKQKNVFKAKDTKQLAKLQTQELDKTKMEINVDKIKIEIPKDLEVLVKFKEGPIAGVRNVTQDAYPSCVFVAHRVYKGKTLRELWDIHVASHKNVSDPSCPFCLHSDSEMNVEFVKQRTIPSKCIEGQTIVDINKVSKTDEHDKTHMLLHTNYEIPVLDIGDNEKKLHTKSGSPKTQDQGQITTSGVTRYVLSDRTFIEKGWTVLPTEKVMRKMNVYRMRPAKPEFDWFKRHRGKEMFYEGGERFVEHQEDGRCRWFYKNDRLALDYYDAAELNAQQRFVIYSNGEPDGRGRARPYTVLAMFDYLGNGVVFDHGGKIRLKYNQTEGVVLDRSIGPVSHWQWHTLNDPPVLQKVMIDTQLAHKDPNILKMGEKEEKYRKHDLDNEEMMVIEFDNFIKEKSQKLTQNFKPFQIRMKAMKINENFSLKVLDQANVYLIFRDGTTNIKVNIGMMLDHKEIIDTDTVEVGDVANSLELLPARTDSLAELQKRVACAQRFEKTRTERERRLRPPEPNASADKLTAAASRPMRPPLRAFNPSSTTSTTNSTKSYKRPLTNNMYYSTT